MAALTASLDSLDSKLRGLDSGFVLFKGDGQQQMCTTLGQGARGGLVRQVPAD